MLLVVLVFYRLAGLCVKLLPRIFSNEAVELDIRRVKLGLSRFERIVKALDQSRDFIAIKISVVIVEIVKVGRLVILGFVITSLHAPYISPVRGRRMIGAEKIVRTRNP